MSGRPIRGLRRSTHVNALARDVRDSTRSRRDGVLASMHHHDEALMEARDARSKSAFSDLRQLTVDSSTAREPLRVRDPEQVVCEWKGLIAARWTLLEVSETDGRRYLVARQKRPRTQGPNGLTEREQEVVAFAAMGQHNKLIAYNLGIAHSTVRVLIARAARKLGAHSRRELIRRWIPSAESSI